MSISLALPTYSRSDLWEIGNKINMSETSGIKKNLVFWNPKEDFPSMGIGHFVWVPAEGNMNFPPDIFSKFLEFCKAKGIRLPRWLQENQQCPWGDRGDFVRSENNSDARQLRKVREFLHFNKRIQAEFILVNFFKSLPEIIEKLPEPLQQEGVEYCNLLLSDPKGSFALIDYNHFKGWGLSVSPEYNHQGWGLKQVLERALVQEWRDQPLTVFIQAAKETLLNRVENAPIHKKNIEMTFIKGWFNRLERYMS